MVFYVFVVRRVHIDIVKVNRVLCGSECGLILSEFSLLKNYSESHIYRVKVDSINFFRTIVSLTYIWFHRAHRRWGPCAGPVGPKWGPLMRPTCRICVSGSHRRWDPLMGPTSSRPMDPTCGGHVSRAHM